MAQTSKRILVVLNAGSGKGAAEAAAAIVCPILRDAGHDVTVSLLEQAADLEPALESAIARGVDVIVAGGGDGTVNGVANGIMGSDITLGVLPLGTLNHFAKDIGIPLAMEEAAAVLVAGHTRHVDVGVVNDKVFLNNSSLGLYPRIVQLRERYRARGLEKWVVAAWATLRVTGRQKPLRLHIRVDGEDVVCATPLLFVGNNEYRMAGMDAGSRESLTGGRLALYRVNDEGRWSLVRLVWRILVGTATGSGELVLTLATDATIDLPFSANSVSLPVAVDGEVTTMALPLHYVLRPAALRVIVPE